MNDLSKLNPVSATKRERFLELLKLTCNVSAAARGAGFDRRNAYTQRETDAEFARAWDDALEHAYDEMEHEARRRAFAGYEEPLTHQGQFTYLFDHTKLDEEGRPSPVLDANGKHAIATVRKYSDSLTTFLLSAYRPKFRPKSSMELTGAEGGPVKFEDAEKAQRIAAILAAAAQRKADDEYSDLL
jgi:hypothetical protein